MLTKYKLLDLITEQSVELGELRTRIVDLEQEVSAIRRHLICPTPDRLEKAIADVVKNNS